MIWDPEIETLPRERLRELQLERLRSTVDRILRHVPYSAAKLKAAGIISGADIRSLADLPSLPFTTKDDLLDNYPFGLFAVPLPDVSGIHASSGTRGMPRVVGYTGAPGVAHSGRPFPPRDFRHRFRGTAACRPGRRAGLRSRRQSLSIRSGAHSAGYSGRRAPLPIGGGEAARAGRDPPTARAGACRHQHRELRQRVEHGLREQIGLTIHVSLMERGQVPRSEGKAVRVVDRRSSPRY